MQYVLVYLLLGHVIGDFLLQSRALAERKRTQRSALLQHLGWLTLAHLLALIPLPLAGATWSRHWLWLFPAVIIAHGLVDAGKAAVERRYGESLRTFLIDQALHVACLVAVAVAAHALSAQPIFRPLSPRGDVTGAAIVFMAYMLCATAGSAIVRLTLGPMQDGNATASLTEPTQQRRHYGHKIGVLERWLGLTFVLLDAWAGLAGIIAAKSIARFKDLENRDFAEYYLVGTLTSLLVTVAVGMATVRSLQLLT